MARSERTDGGTRPDSTRKRTPRSEPSAAAVDAGLLTQESPLTASMGSDFSQTTLECHAAVLGDSRMSRPMYRRQRTEYMLRLQRDYGNRYVQRLVDHIMRKRDEQEQIGLEGGDVGPDVEKNIQQTQGNGQSLPDKVRTPMEQAFGADFSGVRVHTGSEADSLNRSMSARAFTTGQDIFFANGEFNPDSAGGRETLAHELTHVVQQEGTSLVNRQAQRSPAVIQRQGDGATEEEGEGDEIEELYDPALEQEDAQSLSASEEEQASEDDGDQGGGDSAFLEAEAINDTDLYDYTQQGDEYSVD